MSPGKIILFIKCILVPLNVKLLEFTVVVIFVGKVALEANLKLSMLIFMATAASEEHKAIIKISIVFTKLTLIICRFKTGMLLIVAFK